MVARTLAKCVGELTQQSRLEWWEGGRNGVHSAARVLQCDGQGAAQCINGKGLQGGGQGAVQWLEMVHSVVLSCQKERALDAGVLQGKVRQRSVSAFGVKSI